MRMVMGITIMAIVMRHEKIKQSNITIIEVLVMQTKQ